jgi:hypothetical protein
VVAVQDDAAIFAAAAVSLLRDDTAWEKQCREQLEYAQAQFSRAALTASLLKALSKPGRADNYPVSNATPQTSAKPSGSDRHLQLLQS